MTSNTLARQWGERIRQLREDRGLSLKELERRTRIDHAQLWNVERGTKGLGDEARIRLAAALGVQVAEIFEYPDTTNVEAG